MSQLELPRDMSDEKWELEQSRDEDVRRKRVTEILAEIYIFMPETARELAGLVGFKTELEQAFNKAAQRRFEPRGERNMTTSTADTPRPLDANVRHTGDKSGNYLID